MTSLSPQIGRAVGWKVEVAGETIDHSTHYAHIEATLSGDLSGGSYRIEIERLNNQSFQRISHAWQPSEPGGERPIVELRLTLLWRDRVGTGPLAAPTPVTAVLAITNLSRSVSGTRISTVIEAREWVFEKIDRATLRAAACFIGPMAALSQALQDAGLAGHFTLYPADDAAQREATNFDIHTPVMAVLERVGERLAEGSRRTGRGFFLIRDGNLHAGADRPIPFAELPAPELTPASGLIRAENQGRRRPSPAERARAAESQVQIVERDAYSLTLTGRPDLKPGDVAKFYLDASGQPAADSSSGREVRIYLASVQHQLGKNEGWRTTAAGVTVGGAAGNWDPFVPDIQRGTRAGGRDADSADPALAVAHQIGDEIDERLASVAVTRVGEVRANHQETQVSGDSVSVAAQSLDLFVGLEVPDGLVRRARRQEVRRADNPHANVPYLTPFAWGPYGLVLPHYPGERVLVSHHESHPDDPVVLGSLWQSASSSGSTPQNTQAGDWWLILPAAIAPADRSSVAGTNPVSIPSNAKAVHDLIDASGARVIQMQELTIRTLPEADLGTPQTRPQAGANGGILITHNNGAKIQIANDGSITIESPKGLKLKATDDVEIEGRNIKLKGSSVDVVS